MWRFVVLALTLSATGFASDPDPWLSSVSIRADVDETWLKAVSSRMDQDAVLWLRSGLKEELAKRPLTEMKTTTAPAPGKCITEGAVVPTEPKLLVFMSFSVPENAWLALSSDLNRLDGVFVLRGLPENSFQTLAQQLLALREKGLSASVQLHPKLYEEYGVISVPAIVLVGEECFDKVTGNISIPFVLDLIAEQGETSALAKTLKERLRAKI